MRGGKRALVLAAVLVSASASPAQSQYPYWGTAPESYRGTRPNVPVPGMSPSAISNAARSPSGSADTGSLGGAYLPRFLATPDLDLGFTRSARDNRARIWLQVPRNAEIWVEGVKTRQTGETRYFYSPALTPGKRYSYTLRIRWTKDGKVVEEKQSFVVSAGATIRHDFTRARDKDSAARK